MDTLVYSVSTFMIPINVAALRGKYDLMNVYLGLTLTSWAHHGITHELSCLKRDGCKTVYNVIDLVMCRVAVAYTLWYAVLFTSRLQFFVYFVSLMSVVFSYYGYVTHNRLYYIRGLENWRLHKAHIIMHLSTCVGFTAIAL